MSDPEVWPRVRRAGAAAAAGVVGVVVGLAGALVHRHVLRSDGTMILPWGVAFALATIFAVTLAAGRLARGLGAVATAAGWIVALLWLDQGRPEGDAVILGDGLSAAYVFGGMLTVGVAVVRGMTGSATAVRPRSDGPPA